MDPFAQNEALVAALQTGDSHAAETLLRLNRPLVCKLAHVYLAGAGSLEIDDLLQEGALGLLRAAALFDPAHGARFSTYATPWIRQFMVRAIAATGATIHIPCNIPWSAALPAVVVSLDQPLGADRDTSRLDFAPAPVDVEATVVASVWSHTLLAALPAQERAVISARCGFDAAGPQTLRAIGARCGFTPEGVRQVEKRALRKLRRLLAQGNSPARTRGRVKLLTARPGKPLSPPLDTVGPEPELPGRPCVYRGTAALRNTRPGIPPRQHRLSHRSGDPRALNGRRPISIVPG
jgi:RNA polymerase sigma factor (sigma-70 family)